MEEIEILEDNILGAFLVDTSTHKYIADLKTETFISSNAKKVFKIIKDMYLNKQDINLISVNNVLSTGITKKNDTLKYLVTITDKIVTTSAVEECINKLKDVKIRIALKEIITKTYDELKDVNVSAIGIKNNLVKKIDKIKDNSNNTIASSVQDTLSKTLDEIEKKYKVGEDYSLYTGFFDLDKLTDGLHENELTAIGARPGTGKTAFAINIAENIAKNGKKVYFLSLEMSKEQLMQRIIANYCKINTQFLRTGRVQLEEIKKIAEKTNDILKLKLSIDTKTRYIEELEEIATNLKQKNNIDVLIIDYLTLLKSKEKYAIRELEVAEISRRLKLLALDLNIPILILVQLNRDAENKVPSMANIRESGSIEQNCDNIIFLHKEEQDKKLVEIIQVILEKQRQGGTGTLKLKFDKKYSRFYNITR